MYIGKTGPQAVKLSNNQPIPLPSAKAERLRQLEAQSIHIFREVVAEFEKPVLLYSIGKDSSVLLHLAMKAFAPGPLPFPLLHVDTTWKFKDMYRFRDQTAERYGLNLIVHINQDGLKRGINPFASGSSVHTHIMKTEALKQALDIYGFNAAFGGARRDEEKSRAKERVLSFRAPGHVWDPRQQRPELWSLFNTKINKGESVRAFPLSDWTEMDVWHYIRAENIDVVPLYFAASRPVVLRSGTWIMVDDDRMPLQPDEQIVERQIRFRTLGCWPLSGAIESDACSIDTIIDEMQSAGTSERQGRLIDSDESASMERKKKEGYF
jgi:sulfate adenylyltransferase subunit 2